MMRKDERINQVKTGISILLAAASVILTAAARQVPGFARWYGANLYPVWVGSIGRVTGCFPFSISELLLYILLLYILAGFIDMVIRRLFRLSKRRHSLFRNIILLTSVLYFLYVVNCGINYHKDSFSETSGIVVEKYTPEELKEVCQWLTDRVGVYSGKVERGTRGRCRLIFP